MHRYKPTPPTSAPSPCLPRNDSDLHARRQARRRRRCRTPERAGLDGLRLHDLRHGCATFMLAAGVPSRAIMEVLGRSGIRVTMNTYAHVLPVLRQEAADAIDELFGA
ncbi:MAG TPA: tyrosine-type recombinase/integrase [Burkholderiales bacterium]|nr:tyrosine-type recombinase/integrase [Burkholderiales bacterium]